MCPVPELNAGILGDSEPWVTKEAQYLTLSRGVGLHEGARPWFPSGRPAQ